MSQPLLTIIETLLSSCMECAWNMMEYVEYVHFSLSFFFFFVCVCSLLHQISLVLTAIKTTDVKWEINHNSISLLIYKV